MPTILSASHLVLFFGATMLFLVAIGIHDQRTSGRVYPVSFPHGLTVASESKQVLKAF